MMTNLRPPLQPTRSDPTDACLRPPPRYAPPHVSPQEDTNRRTTRRSQHSEQSPHQSASIIRVRSRVIGAGKRAACLLLIFLFLLVSACCLGMRRCRDAAAVGAVGVRRRHLLRQWGGEDGRRYDVIQRYSIWYKLICLFLH